MSIKSLIEARWSVFWICKTGMLLVFLTESVQVMKNWGYRELELFDKWGAENNLVLLILLAYLVQFIASIVSGPSAFVIYLYSKFKNAFAHRQTKTEFLYTRPRAVSCVTCLVIEAQRRFVSCQCPQIHISLSLRLLSPWPWSE